MKTLLYCFIFILCAKAGFPQSPKVVVNELLASNTSSQKDPDYNTYSDWLELFNPQDIEIDLSNTFLTDDFNDPDKWRIPAGTSLTPGEFLLVWADGKDTVLSGYHASFRLSKSGGEIGLFDSNKALIDQISYDNQIVDISYGRKPDGGEYWYFFEQSTPGQSNNSSIYLQAEKPRFSLSPGFYTDNQILEIISDDPLATIRYTINGNEPTIDSPVYSEPVLLKSREGEANLFSEIRTNMDPHSWLPDWTPPAGEVFKANIIRARAFKEGYDPSKIVTGTYFINKDIFQRYSTLPVISVISDYKHLFDYNTGIYVPGIFHKVGDSGSGNYFQDWEKPAHIEYFEPGGNLGFAQDVGINIQGGTSPASPQKGLHVIARSKYGNNRINYPIFRNDPSKGKNLTEFKRFIIRAWGSLISASLFGDAYAHRIMAKNDLDIQAYQPAVVFINGEYWGLHELREANKNSWYYQYHYGIDRENPGYDILLHSLRNGLPYANVDEGDAEHWIAMRNYLNTHNMNLPDNYEYIKTQIDINNFIAYLGHCIYLGKWDWPNNNDASWRPRITGGKWRWIQYDMETGFGIATGLGPEYTELGSQLNMLDAVIKGINIPGFGRYGPHPIMAKLYNNEEFKESFINWFYVHLNHEFKPDSMNHLLDKMAEEIRPYMEEYTRRYPFIGNLSNGWENSLLQVKEFNKIRPEFMIKHLAEQYDTTISHFEKTENAVPLQYSLSQNYPNPFNPTTTIKYEIPDFGYAGSTNAGTIHELSLPNEQMEVKLIIYDILGREIKILVDEYQAPGTYETEFNAYALPSGIYFYRLEAGDFVDVKKMILLR